MGLPARQRRVLDRIECTLRGSDPRLAALYAIFARLTRDEEMPRIEQLRHSAVLLAARFRFRLTTILSRVFGRLVPRQRAAIFFPLALALAITSIVFAARSSSGSAGCTRVTPLAVGAKYVANSKICKIPAVPNSMGH
jgi:hypothetical protein